MISKNEHMINALIQRLEELRSGKFGAVADLSYSFIILHIFDITKNYVVDRRDLLTLMGMSNLSPNELAIIANLDYEDNAK